MCNKGLRRLAGRRIDHIKVDADKQYFLLFETDIGALCYEAVGDLSEAWFADVIGVKALLGQVVIEVNEIDLPIPQDDRTRQEMDYAYGFELRTVRGVCTVIFRNSNYGYYGGWLEECESPSDKVWQSITDDWSA